MTFSKFIDFERKTFLNAQISLSFEGKVRVNRRRKVAEEEMGAKWRQKGKGEKGL